MKAHGPRSVTAMVHESSQHAEEAVRCRRLRELGVSVFECDLLRLPAQPPRWRVDVIYHLAASATTEDPGARFEVNSDGTCQLLNWLGSSLKGKRVIYTGTLASVDLEDLRLAPVTEATPCTPKTPYGRTKLLGEEWVRKKAAEFGYDYTILRLCTIVGRGYRPGGMFGVLPQLLRRDSWASRLNWPGRVSLLSVTDLTEILLALPTLSQTSNELYVASNGETLTFDGILDEMARLLGVRRTRVCLPRWLWWFMGSVSWHAMSTPGIPYRWQNFAWRLSHLIRGGLWADAAKLNQALRRRFESAADAMREIYADPSRQL